VADAVDEDEAAPAEAAAPELLPVRTASAFRRQFGLAYGALGVALAGAVIATVVLGLQPSEKTASVSHAASGGAVASDEWSAWAPTTPIADRPFEIAAHIAPTYRLPSGNQLINVSPFPSRFNGAPISAIVVNPSSGTDEPPAYVPYEESIVYVLCGELPNCAIKEGKPSLARGRLVRRQALELALYTFRYVEGVSYVVAVFPPPTTTADGPERAVLWQRSDLAAQLEQPLSATLSGEEPPELFRIPPAEVKAIDRLADSHTLIFHGFAQAQDGTAEIVLEVPGQTSP